MSWEMHKKEFESVSSLPAGKRYSYFIKKVADFEEIWSLWSEGGWALASDNGHQLVPIWPHEQFALSCASKGWAGYEPKKIELTVWMSRWISGLIRDQRSVVVFPTIFEKGIVVSPERLREDLEAEISLYE
jgi:hypothetical protein